MKSSEERDVPWTWMASESCPRCTGENNEWSELGLPYGDEDGAQFPERLLHFLSEGLRRALAAATASTNAEPEEVVLVTVAQSVAPEHRRTERHHDVVTC